MPGSPDAQTIAPPSEATADKRPAGETPQAVQEKSFLAKKAEQAKNLAVKLKNSLKRNPQNAQSEFINLARGTNDEATNNQRQDHVINILRNGLPQPDAPRTAVATTDVKIPTTADTSQAAAEAGQLPGGPPPGSESAGVYARRLQKQPGEYAADGVTINPPLADKNQKPDDPQLAASKAASSPPEGQTAAADSDESAKLPVESTAEVAEQEVTELAQRLNEVGGDPSKLSATELQTFKKIMATQITAQEAKNSAQPEAENTSAPADGTSATETAQTDSPAEELSASTTPESTKPIDAASAKKSIEDMGVDPTSEAGVKLFDLIDSATPDALMGLWDKVTTAEGAADLATKYFSEHGFKGSLNPKNMFKFALSEIVSEQQKIKGEQSDFEVTEEADEKTEEKTKLRTKIMEMLVTLAMALGAVAVEAFKGSADGLQESAKK